MCVCVYVFLLRPCASFFFSLVTSNLYRPFVSFIINFIFVGFVSLLSCVRFASYDFVFVRSSEISKTHTNTNTKIFIRGVQAKSWIEERRKNQYLKEINHTIFIYVCLWCNVTALWQTETVKWRQSCARPRVSECLCLYQNRNEMKWIDMIKCEREKKRETSSQRKKVEVA